MRHIETRTVDPRALWPTLVWVLIGIETLAMLWFHTAFVPVDRSLDGYLWQCGVLYGYQGEDIGVIAALSIVNLIVVIGLWVAYRSSRRLGTLAARASTLR